jgi:hypothetical protein
MALDPALTKAIEDTVAKLGQPRAVGQRLTAWLVSLSDGENTEDLNNRFYDDLVEAVTLEDEDDAD